MIAQTNIQLYHQLLVANWDELSLKMIRSAYELAVELFDGCYRPGGRPFVCHLVGVASILAEWREAPSVVAAGLLHSAYMYGNFSDRSRHTSPRRRAQLVERVGVPAEALVFAYTEAKQSSAFSRWLTAAETLNLSSRSVATMLLADLCDDCAGGEPRYAPSKKFEAGLPWHPERRSQALALARSTIGQQAEHDLGTAFQELDNARIPDVLCTSQSGSTGISSHKRSKLRLFRGMRHFLRTIVPKRAAG